jgi:hypothetical protein
LSDDTSDSRVSEGIRYHNNLCHVIGDNRSRLVIRIVQINSTTGRRWARCSHAGRWLRRLRVRERGVDGEENTAGSISTGRHPTTGVTGASSSETTAELLVVARTWHITVTLVGDSTGVGVESISAVASSTVVSIHLYT